MATVDDETKAKIEADIAEIDGGSKPAPKPTAPKLATEDGPVCHSCTFPGGQLGTGLIDEHTACPYCNGTGHLS